MGQLTTDLEQELCYLIKGQVVKFEMKCNEENIKKFSRLVSIIFQVFVWGTFSICAGEKSIVKIQISQ